MARKSSTSMIVSNTVIYAVGCVLIVLSALLTLPLAFDVGTGQTSAGSFLISSFLCLFIGGLLYFSHKSSVRSITIRSAFLLTLFAWLVVSFFCALPFYFGHLDLSFTDAMFESVSGLTTTGATVMSGLDELPRDILFWRSLTQTIGGLGIVVIAMTILPFLRVGGMQLFHAESSDRHDKVSPRIGDIAKGIVFVYLMLLTFCFIAYLIGGMSSFDALNHALTTIPTGGFSTHDASFGFFSSPFLQWAATLFMFLSGLPFILYFRWLIKRDFAFWEDEQVRFFTLLCAGLIAALSVWMIATQNTGLHEAVRLSAFNFISVITTTGYATADYLGWGSFAVMLFFLVTYLGACAGSTTGGIKIMRIVLIVRAVKMELTRLAFPHRALHITYQGRLIDPKLIYDVLGFLSFYVVLNVALSLALSLTGLDIETSISGAATAIANVGPGIGSIIGPAGNFSSLPDAAKWLLMFGMLAGRLEIMVFLVFFNRAFWRN